LRQCRDNFTAVVNGVGELQHRVAALFDDKQL